MSKDDVEAYNSDNDEPDAPSVRGKGQSAMIEFNKLHPVQKTKN